jgi:hypothetical protein
MSLADGFSTPDFVFDFDEAIAPKGFEPLPSGVYDVVITDAEVLPTSKGGVMIKVTYQVESNDDFNERLVIENWNMPDKAKQEPKKYKESLGFLQQKLEACTNQRVTGNFKLNPMDLPGCRLKVQLGIRPGRTDPETGKDYGPQNVVRKYISSSGQTFEHSEQRESNGANGGQPQQQAPQQQQQPQEQGAGSFRI